MLPLNRAANCFHDLSAGPLAGPLQDPRADSSLEETRLTMGKWIETQQIISKERNEWQQGKEILQGRLELVKKETAGLEEKNGKTMTVGNSTERRRSGLYAERRLSRRRLAGRVGDADGQCEGGHRRIRDAAQLSNRG